MHSQDTDRYPLPDWAVALIIAEAIALLLALILPVMPTKTGTSWSPAELLSDEPTYLFEVVTGFVLVNVVMILFGLFIWLSKGKK